jgi:AcrR family transcriptional regulator
MTDAPVSGGTPARGRRMKQEDLRELMLRTAEEQLDGRGIGVNAYPLNMEDLIRHVGVPRSSAFNAFGNKENLVFQLALRMLDPHSPLAVHFAAMWVRVADQVAAEHPDRDGFAMLRETVRLSVRMNHDLLAGSARWRTFRALTMSLDSFPDGEREVLTDRLHRIQEDYVSTMAGCYAEIFERFGVRTRAGIDIRHFTGAVSSALEGIATDRAFGPAVPEKLLTLPGIDGEPVEWHLASVAFFALIEGMTERV